MRNETAMASMSAVVPSTLADRATSSRSCAVRFTTWSSTPRACRRVGMGALIITLRLLVEDLRETPFWDRYFAIVEILPGVRMHAKNCGRGRWVREGALKSALSPGEDFNQ